MGKWTDAYEELQEMYGSGVPIGDIDEMWPMNSPAGWCCTAWPHCDCGQ